jgi:hypothetical protein
MRPRGAFVTRGRAAMLGVLVLAACPAPRGRAPETTAPAAAEVEHPEATVVVADFDAPQLSAQSVAAWRAFAQERCEQAARRRAHDDACKAPWHARPCRERDLAAELAACTDAHSCLRAAQASHECRPCDGPDLQARARARVAGFASDCAGTLRFADEVGFDPDALYRAVEGEGALACLAGSDHPRARLLIGMRASDARAQEILLGDKDATRAWIRVEIDRFVAGESGTAQADVVWDVLDLLGGDAAPLLPDLRRLAAHSFVGWWDGERIGREAVLRLGALGDRDSVPLLRRMLTNARDFRGQAAAARALASLGTAASAARTELRDVSRSHRDLEVRALAGWAAARVGGDADAPEPDLRALPWKLDRRCPVVPVDVEGEGNFRFDMPRQWPWAAMVDGETIVLAERDTTDVVALPADFPGVDLAKQFPRIPRTTVPLKDAVQAIHELAGGWVVGTDFGEFGGSLFWVSRRGKVRHLADGNVLAIARLGGELYAVHALNHMGGSHGTLLRIRSTRQGVRVEHALELPEGPEAIAIRDDAFYLGTTQGIAMVRPSLEIEILPCVAERIYDGTISREAVRETIAAVRPIVDRCLEALPSADLGCGESNDPIVPMWFDLDEHGRVAAVTPLDRFASVRFPEVERCLAEHGATWRFPAPKGGWATFGYVFARAEPVP